MYESILQQKKAIKQEQRTLELKNQELSNKKEIEELEAKRVILDTFDKTQNSMLGNRQVHTNDKKRKLDQVEEEKTIHEKEVEETAAKLRAEKEEAAKPKIGSFWVVNRSISYKTLLFY
jgi:nitric oxide synthase-interacting protein